MAFLRARSLSVVGVLGIEPSQHAPKACVLPVYDTPEHSILLYSISTQNSVRKFFHMRLLARTHMIITEHMQQAVYE